MSSYTLNVTLADIHPRIWRQIRVPGDMTLAGLHEVLQIALGWTDSHPHEFEVGKRPFGVPDPDDERDVADEAEPSVAEALPSTRSTIRYTYDLGDEWVHNIAVDGIEPESLPGRTAPVACLRSASGAA